MMTKITSPFLITLIDFYLVFPTLLVVEENSIFHKFSEMLIGHFHFSMFKLSKAETLQKKLVSFSFLF